MAFPGWAFCTTAPWGGIWTGAWWMAFRQGQERGQMGESSKDTSAVVEYHMVLMMTCRPFPGCQAVCQAFSRLRWIRSLQETQWVVQPLSDEDSEGTSRREVNGSESHPRGCMNSVGRPNALSRSLGPIFSVTGSCWLPEKSDDRKRPGLLWLWGLPPSRDVIATT